MTDTEEDSTGSDSWPVNEDWLIEMLKQHHCTNNDIKIADFSAKQGCSEGVSNLSDILAVSVVYNIASLPTEMASTEVSGHSEKLELIIKLLPHDPFSRYFVTEAKFDLREIRFYTRVMPDLMEFQKRIIKAGSEKLSICVPKCFYTHYSPGKLLTQSPEPPESILVLEDMRSAGYKVLIVCQNFIDFILKLLLKGVDFVRGLNFEQAEYAIKAVASVHALSLGLKFKEKIELNEKYPVSYFIISLIGHDCINFSLFKFLFQINKATESYQQLLEQGLPQLSKFLQQKGNYGAELEVLEQLRPKTKALIENLLQPIEPMGVMTHTDFWCNNLLFKVEPNDSRNDNCTILDWQMITYSLPTNDIALLITSSLPASIRRQHTTKLLDLYYNLLRSNCKKLSLDLEIDLQYSRNKMECDFR